MLPTFFGAASFTISTVSSLRARTTPRRSGLPTHGFQHVRVSMLAPAEELRFEDAPLDGEMPLAELAHLVARLGAECPWTRAQNTSDVLRYMRAELLEVEQAASRSGSEAEAEAGEQTDELADELGDVLFNALLLIEVARRERPQLSVDTSAAAAVRKLRRPRHASPTPTRTSSYLGPKPSPNPDPYQPGGRRTSSAGRLSPALPRLRQRGRAPRP